VISHTAIEIMTIKEIGTKHTENTGTNEWNNSLWTNQTSCENHSCYSTFVLVFWKL